MRTVLVGAVESTRVALESLVSAGDPPLAIFTLPADRAARHSDFVDLSLHARRWGVEVVYGSNVNSPDVLSWAHSLEPDYLLVIGWSQLCGPDLLSCARKGTIGYHPAALPENRGRAVIPWTIIQGADATGSTLFWLDEGVDSGDLLAQKTVLLAPDETAASLYRKHADALAAMMAEVVPLLAAGSAPRTPQDHSRATYCARRTIRDGWIDWMRPAREIWTLIRATGDPYPGAFTVIGDSRLTIWAADYVGSAPYSGLAGQVQTLSDDGALVKCGDGQHVLVKAVQLEGGPKTSPTKILKNHARLGLDAWDLLQMAQRPTVRE